MKHKPEYAEGPEAATRFNAAMRKVLTVSHAELKRRIEADNAAQPPRGRGRPPKIKP
jgi:hypothetical protein